MSLLVMRIWVANFDAQSQIFLLERANKPWQATEVSLQARKSEQTAETAPTFITF